MSEQICPPLKDVLLMAWRGFIQQRSLDRQKLLEIFEQCPPEYLEQTAKIYGLSQALAEANSKVTNSCYPALSLGVVLLTELTNELQIADEPVRRDWLPIEETPAATIEDHVLSCNYCQHCLDELRRRVQEHTDKFQEDPAECLSRM